MTTDVASILETLGNGGALAILVSYMIWDKIQMRKDRQAEECLRAEERKIDEQKLEAERSRNNLTLERLAQANENLAGSNENIANTLELLKMQMETHDILLRGHDERAIKIKEEMTEVKTIVGSCHGRISR